MRLITLYFLLLQIEQSAPDKQDEIHDVELEAFIQTHFDIYMKACKHGHAKVFNGLMMVVGGPGDGKSSLIERLAGENINPKHDITNALKSDISCKVDITKINRAWLKINENRSETIENDLTVALASAMKNVSEKKPIKEKAKQPKNVLYRLGIFGRKKKPISESQDGAAAHLDIDNSTGDPSKSQNLIRARLREVRNLQSEENLIERIEGPCHDHSVIFVWDFGGQLVYYSIHQVFLRATCVYVLVINLTIPLEKKRLDVQGSCDSKSNRSQLYIQEIEFWINLILSHMKKAQHAKGKGSIILVGTHKDKLHSDINQRESLADEYFQRLKDMLRNTQHKNLIRKCFAVDSLGGDEETYEKLREELMAAIKIHCNWGQIRPIRWLLLAKHLHELKSDVTIRQIDRNLVRLEKVHEFGSGYGMKEEEVKLFLEFFHRCGDLTYLPTEGLKGYVIPNPQFLVNVFRSVINLDQFFPEDTETQEDIDKLRKDGMLRRNLSLLSVLWDEVLQSTKEEEKETVIEFLLNIMEEFDMIVPHREKMFFVPNMLPWSPGTTESLFPNMIQTAPALYFLFHSSTDSHESFLEGSTMYDQFLPYGLFQRLISRCVKLGWRWLEHKYRDLVSYRSDDCVVVLSSQSSWIKLEVLVADNNTAVEFDKFNRNISRELKTMLAVYNQNMWFEYSVNVCGAHGHECIINTGRSNLGGKLGLAICPTHDNCLTIPQFAMWFSREACRVLTQKDLMTLADELTDEWKRVKLGTELGIEVNEIEATKQDNPEIRLASFNMLLSWYNQQIFKADAFIKLSEALKEAGMGRLIKKCLDKR